MLTSQGLALFRLAVMTGRVYSCRFLARALGLDSLPKIFR